MDHLSRKHVCEVLSRKNKLNPCSCAFGECEAGISGPLNAYQGDENPESWKMYDDDGILYYSGMIYGEYSGFEPLDDWGSPIAGCSEIWINGERL